jgi:hypothetical protein
MVVVPNRDSDTLRDALDKYVEKGTIIISDSWKRYSKFSEINFENKQVNHNETYVNPLDRNIHT